MITLRTLGGVNAVAADGRELHDFLRQPKQIAILSYLAVAGRGEQFVRRDKLLALFWPKADPERARGSLRTLLHRLRKNLGDDALVSRGTDEVRVDGRKIVCDANLLRTAIGMNDFRGALGEYRGDFLDGFSLATYSPEFGAWVSNERRQLREQAVRAATELARGRETGGDLRAAVTLAQRAVTIAGVSSDEASVRLLLRLLIRSGDHSSAVAAFEEFSAKLAAQFRVRPSPETAAIIEPLRAHRPGRRAENETRPTQPVATSKNRTPSPERGTFSRAWKAFGALVLGKSHA